MLSTVVASYFYIPEEKMLTIRYISGMIYLYKSAPGKLFEEFKASISKGKYLNINIKGNHEVAKVIE